MRITLTVEVESREALAALLRAGSDQTMTDYSVIGFHVCPESPPRDPPDGPGTPPRGPLTYTTHAYRDAPSGKGPLAAAWRDKPHRLVYDLAGEVDRLTGAPGYREPIDLAITRGHLPNGYELTDADVGRELCVGYGWGPVKITDVGKRCYLRDGTLQIESVEQRAARKAT